MDDWTFGEPGDIPLFAAVYLSPMSQPRVPAVYRNGAFLLDTGWPTSWGVVYFGDPGDYPLVWNFDQYFAVYRNTRFYLRKAVADFENDRSAVQYLGAADETADYGNPGDVPLMGDWDGSAFCPFSSDCPPDPQTADTIDTIGVYRPSNATFYLRNSNTTGVADLTFFYGELGDVPLVGDWNGDGIDTIGVYRPSDSTFYLRNSNTTGFADITFRFGRPGEYYPVANGVALIQVSS